jgi:hypothetical protein
MLAGEWKDVKGNAKYDVYKTFALLVVVAIAAATVAFVKGAMHVWLGLGAYQKWCFVIAFGLLLVVAISAMIAALRLAWKVRQLRRTVLEIDPAQHQSPQTATRPTEPAMIPSVTALYEANTTFHNRLYELEHAARGRHLRDDQMGRIVRVMSEGLADGTKRLVEVRERQGLPTPKLEIVIEVISIGAEAETVDFRNDFIAAFAAAGYVGVPHYWPAGDPDLEHFRGAITVLNPLRPGHIWHPIVLAALRAAELLVQVADSPPLRYRSSRYRNELLDTEPAVVLVVGQRR